MERQKPPSEVIKYLYKVRSLGSGPGQRRDSWKASEMRRNQTKAFNYLGVLCVCVCVIQMGCCAEHKYDTAPGSLNVHACIQGCMHACSPTSPQASSRAWEGVGFAALPSQCTLMTDSRASLFQPGFCLHMPAEGKEQKGRRGTIQRAALLLVIIAGGVSRLSELISRT